MKKLLALLLCLVFVFCLCACTTEKPNDDPNPSGSSSVDTDLDDEEEKEPLVLEGIDEYVVVARVDSDIEINSIEELKDYTIGVISNTDSQKIGEYYGKECIYASMDNDIMSRFYGGKEGDLAIIRKISYPRYSDRVKIVLDPIVIE